MIAGPSPNIGHYDAAHGHIGIPQPTRGVVHLKQAQFHANGVDQPRSGVQDKFPKHANGHEGHHDRQEEGGGEKGNSLKLFPKEQRDDQG